MNMASKEPVPSETCAVREATNDDERRALTQYFGGPPPADVVTFAPKDDDDLDAELCAGRFGRVVFAGLDALLTAVWKHHAQIDRWTAAGVRIDLAVPPAEDPADWRSFLTCTYASLSRHRRQQRRRQIIAAAILSALALLAIAAFLFTVPATN